MRLASLLLYTGLLTTVVGCSSAPTSQVVNGAPVLTTRDSWYTGFPSSVDRDKSRTDLSHETFSEIPVSHFIAAEQLLESDSSIPLINGYFGYIPQCPAGTQPFLIRAVFERTNGTFLVSIVGTELLVLNLAPGPSEPQRRSALAVCLTFKPTAVYTATGGPM
jgi:hypothetical protein